MATITISSLTGDIAFGARPVPGFYEGGSQRRRFTNAVAGKWQPWNPIVDLQLKKIGKPIALYAKRFGWSKSTRIPDLRRPLGIDLLRGDWVAPYGKGEHPDIIFRLDTQLGGMTKNGYQIHDSVFSVSFADEGSGIQPIFAQPRFGSALRLPRLAPEQGYESHLVRRSYCHEDGRYIEQQDDQNYFIRVRTMKNEKGEIVSALYGKIHGEINWDWTGVVRFTYYLNPSPNDRNLEFDPSKNLFSDLRSTEQVVEP